jgi:hypothetical protein
MAYLEAIVVAFGAYPQGVGLSQLASFVPQESSDNCSIPKPKKFRNIFNP